MKRNLNKSKIYLSFRTKLVLLFLGLILSSTLIIGSVSYITAKDSLDEKGKIILENGVVMALQLIQVEYDKSVNGLIPVSEAQENVKKLLLGEMKADGTRTLHNDINLGKNGYFIIYDKQGNEVMHPILEGQNVWNVTNYSDDFHFIVREQIDIALKGGGFTYYSWLFPYSNKVGEKISYANYFEEWDWIVVSTAYKLDFDSAANTIFYITVFMMLGLFVLSVLIVMKQVNKITKPIMDVSEGMKQVREDKYIEVELTKSKDEVGQLVVGYNNMIRRLKKTRTSLAKTHKKLSYLAFHDELTRLPNRNGLKEFVTKKIKDSCGQGYMLQLDIISLKDINSTMGYDQGDFVLKMISQYFLLNQHNDYYVARTSSNEFTIWVENIEESEAFKFIYLIREEIQRFITEQGNTYLNGMYIAAAKYPEHGEDFETLFRKATMAMKHAKESREIKVYLYEKSMKDSIENDLVMHKYLYNAMVNNEIILYYQEKVDYTTMQVVGVEALARWFSKELGYVGPNDFIPSITRLNLTHEFGDYVLDYALKDFERLVEIYDKNLSLSINISPIYFINKNFVEKVVRLLDKYKVPATRVILEITEDILINDLKLVNQIIGNLRTLGIRVSIDDFGTGYSSLNYLKEVQFDEMKIDKSFIDQIISDSKVAKLFKILCNIAEVYDYSIVAEGVETEEQLKLIQLTSLKIVQGYIFSKPKPLSELSKK